MLLMVSEMLRSMAGSSYVPRGDSVTVCRQEERQKESLRPLHYEGQKSLEVGVLI